MSVGAVGLLVPKPVRPPSRKNGPRLRLVASQAALRAGQPVGPGLTIYIPSPTPTRLTRRGRLVITLLAVLAVTTLAMALTGSANAGSAQFDHVTTVSAGQTLSEVAAVQLPTLPIDNAVAQIQLANGLNTTQVHAGQLLLIPELP
jgi:hypothetical protein